MNEQYIELDATEADTVPAETYNAVVRRCETLELQLENAELRKQVSLRDIAIMERDRLLETLREQGGSEAIASLRQQYNIAIKRAQDAEVKLVAADVEAGRLRQSICLLEAERDTSEGEFDALNQARAARKAGGM